VFKRLFKCPSALTRHLSAPLLKQRQRYLAHLASQGMSRTTLRSAASYLLAIVRQLHLADRPGQRLSHAEIQEQATIWAKLSLQLPRHCGTDCRRQCFLRHATRWLQFLGRLQPTPTQPQPFAAQIAAFADYRSREQSLSPQTISSDCKVLRNFLGRLGAAGQAFEDLTVNHIDQALSKQLADSSYARRTVQILASTLRAFFGYAHRQGWCRHGLAEAIKAPRLFSQESLPCGPSWPDVQRLLALVASPAPLHVRDRAILLLLAVYGFRSGEVACLQLADFDWERELLWVRRSKTQQPQTYPLARPVGDAVIRYLKEVRPRCSRREVFLTLQAPIRPLSSGALWRIVGPRLRALGLTLTHYGPHSLRHACATHLLERGLSLKEIGDHLGHRHPDTTRIYTKVDLGGLRQVADFDLGGLL
jgi:integrase/recombinase XerD